MKSTDRSPLQRVEEACKDDAELGERVRRLLKAYEHPLPTTILAGHEDSVTSAQFSPDGARIVTASWDKSARIWTILPTSAGPPPAWFPEFLRYLAQMRPYLRILRRFVPK